MTNASAECTFNCHLDLKRRQRRILIVEDSLVIRTQIADVLTGSGFLVDELSDGTHVLNQVSNHTPDLILLDLVMPEMSGIEVLARLKQDSRAAGIPIIIITAKSDDAEVARCLELGAIDFLPKPIGDVVLLARIETALRTIDDINRLEAANQNLKQEIEARRDAEQELDRSKRRYGLAIEAGRIGLWEWELETGAFYLASNLQHMLLLESEDLPAEIDEWLQHVHAADRDVLIEHFRQLANGQEEEIELEHRLLRRDGVAIWVLTRA